MAIKQPTRLRFELHEDPPVEGGPLDRLLISHVGSVIEGVQTRRGACYTLSMSADRVQPAERCYFTFVVVFESQVVAVVRRLVPFTYTATYLPR